MIIHRHIRLGYRLIAFFRCKSLFVFKNSISSETGTVLKVQRTNSNDFDITFASINVTID